MKDEESTIVFNKVKLYKQQQKYYDSKDAIGLLTFTVESKNYNVVEIEMWFLNSENIDIDIKYDPKKEMKIIAKINPFETKEIARIILKNDWKFKYVYKISTSAPEKCVQEKFIEEDIKAIEKEIKKNEQKLSQISTDLLPVNQIEKILQDEKIKFLDLDFPPNYNSIIKKNYFEDFINNFEYLVHWRRASDFSLEFDEDMKQKDENEDRSLRVFNIYDPEPNEIVPGLIPDNNFVCALSAIAEKNDLINKIFITKNYSKFGIYQVKLCFNGEWIFITIDDFFPCRPKSEPLVSKSPGNEIWVLILEKAVAKLYEAYFNLVPLNMCDYFSLFTGMPTETIDLKEMLSVIDKQMLFKKLKKLLDKYNLIVAITKSETEVSHQDLKIKDNDDSLLIPNMGYTLLKIESEMKNNVMILRKVWYDPVRDEKIQKLEKENYSNKIEDRDRGLLNFSFDMFLKEFSHVGICHIQNWKETRIRGKFVSIKELENQMENSDAVVSRFYYELHIKKPTKIFIGLNQDDDIYKENDSRKQRIDLAITLLRQENNADEITHIESTDFLIQQNIQIEKQLEPGIYLIVPRTTGCNCFGSDPTKSNNNSDPKTPLYNPKDKSLTNIFISTLKDIFKKFDMSQNKYLKYEDFKSFWKTILDENFREDIFKNSILNKYAKGMETLSEKGFINFFKDMINTRGEDLIRIWLENLGYDKDLYPLRSRCFMLVLHSDNHVKVYTKDSLNNDLNYRINNMILKLFGKEAVNDNKENKNIYSAIEYHSQDGTAISIGLLNKTENPLKITLSFAEDCGLIFSTGKNSIKKWVNPGQIEFFFHFIITPNAKELKYTIIH